MTLIRCEFCDGQGHYYANGKERASSYFIEIVGRAPKENPYVSIHDDVQSFFIADDDLEKFAVNILKALKSKHLKSSKP